MKPIFQCELHYFKSAGLDHIYDGFEKLRKIGIVDITLKQATGDYSKPLLTVIVNNEYTVIYDTLDGINWINGSIDENLNYFKNSIKADFYFKRSFNNDILAHAPENCRVFPLGINYYFRAEGKYPIPFHETIKNYFRDIDIIANAFKFNKASFYSNEFEYYPLPFAENKILFLARLWDPDDVAQEHLKIEREQLNEKRINCIRKCQKEFGSNFIGGLQRSKFSVRHSKELILPYKLTNRVAFLNAVKEHNICIATTGLHNSIGSKFGEYIAASRAILTEPLHYELPGEIENGKNYLTFNNEDEMLENIYFLRKNKDVVYDIMKNNYNYYHNYVRPDRLVLNTLLQMYPNL